MSQASCDCAGVRVKEKKQAPRQAFTLPRCNAGSNSGRARKALHSLQMLQQGAAAAHAAARHARCRLDRTPPSPTPHCVLRRNVFVSLPALAVLILAPRCDAELGMKDNAAVMQALKQYKQQGAVTGGGVADRIASALGQVKRARRVAMSGAIRDARGLLREGGMKTVRLDAAAAAAALPGSAATQGWDNALLDAFDDALRVAERGGETGGVVTTGAALEDALKALLDTTSAAAAVAALPKS